METKEIVRLANQSVDRFGNKALGAYNHRYLKNGCYVPMTHEDYLLVLKATLKVIEIELKKYGRS